jgi:hypothetical protein
MDRLEQLARMTALKRRIESLKVEKRRLLAYLSTANLSEEERKEQGNILDRTLAKVRELLDQLFDLENEENSHNP